MAVGGLRTLRSVSTGCRGRGSGGLSRSRLRAGRSGRLAWPTLGSRPTWSAPTATLPSDGRRSWHPFRDPGPFVVIEESGTPGTCGKRGQLGDAPSPQSGRGLPVGVIDVDRRQVFYLLLGDAEADAVSDSGDGADGDSHFLVAPEVSVLKQHVSHVMTASVDDKPLDSPDVAVGGVDVLPAAHGHVAQRDSVVDGGLKGVGRAALRRVRHARRRLCRRRPSRVTSRAELRTALAACVVYHSLGLNCSTTSMPPHSGSARHGRSPRKLPATSSIRRPQASAAGTGCRT